jgi:hypothetical protein
MRDIIPQPSALELDRLVRSTFRDRIDRTLDELFPLLWTIRTERIDRYTAISAGLGGILDRWRGRTWDVYLWETPRSLLARRGCGPVTLGELLWMAELRAAVGTAVPARRHPRRQTMSVRISRSGATSLRRGRRHRPSIGSRSGSPRQVPRTEATIRTRHTHLRAQANRQEAQTDPLVQK